MTGFYFNDNSKQNIKFSGFKLKDKEGINFEDQFISLKKEKENKEKDNHKDENIDIRNFIYLDSE